MKNILAIALLAISTSASADTWYGINGVSYHYNDVKHNEFNLGVSKLWDCRSLECQAGVYVNSRGFSVKNITPYFLADKMVMSNVGLFAGVAYYTDNGEKSEDFKPMGGAVLKYKLPNTGFTSVLRITPTVATFGVELR